MQDYVYLLRLLNNLERNKNFERSGGLYTHTTQALTTGRYPFLSLTQTSGTVIKFSKSEIEHPKRRSPLEYLKKTTNYEKSEITVAYQPILLASHPFV